MPKAKTDDTYSSEEAERRATDALRRALTTPYKPQSEMKLGHKKKTKRVSKKRRPKSA